MEKLRSWSAQRAGAFITITAKDEAGQPRRVTGVKRIEPGKPSPIALDKNGVRYQLA